MRASDDTKQPLATALLAFALTTIAFCYLYINWALIPFFGTAFYLVSGVFFYFFYSKSASLINLAVIAGMILSLALWLGNPEGVFDTLRSRGW